MDVGDGVCPQLSLDTDLEDTDMSGWNLEKIVSTIYGGGVSAIRIR